MGRPVNSTGIGSGLLRSALLVALLYGLGNGAGQNRIEYRQVLGTSLSGLVSPGEIISLELGYYDSQPVKRLDLVAYAYRGAHNPIVKIVKGLPGDKFEVESMEDGCTIHINSGVLKNSLGDSYRFSVRACDMLRLYERDFSSVIPRNSYLVLGNLQTGSQDSSRFGLISGKDILGRVERTFREAAQVDAKDTGRKPNPAENEGPMAQPSAAQPGSVMALKPKSTPQESARVPSTAIPATPAPVAPGSRQ